MTSDMFAGILIGAGLVSLMWCYEEYRKLRNKLKKD